MANLNYAETYSKALDQAYPYSLYFGALWKNDNSRKYRVIDSKTISIPHINITKGRSNGNRDTIGGFSRNADNNWETKTLTKHRIWKTLVHPMDIVQTNTVMSIQNVTEVYNQEKKFPEMDAETIDSIYRAKEAKGGIIKVTGDLTDPKTALTNFDKIMDAMDEARVPAMGRILYVDTYTKTALDNAIAIQRTSKDRELIRAVSRLDEVEIVSVPTSAMKSKYTFDAEDGFDVADDATDVYMFLVHPSAVLPFANYTFSQLGEPSTLSEGKYTYFEESFEDIFLLDHKVDGVQFVVKDKTV